MTKHENTPEYTLDNAVRDICSVSVAPASKSEVKRIIEILLTSQKQKQIEEIVGIAEGMKIRRKYVRDDGVVILKVQKCKRNTALDDFITKIQAKQ